MKLLLVHERFGEWGGAEVQIYATAAELKQRGHCVGLIHGSGTGRGERQWEDLFESRYNLESEHRAHIVREAVRQFDPDIIYTQSISDAEVLAEIASLARCGVPVVRQVHDHNLYCMRGYKYHPLTRHVCRRAASLYCVFGCGACVTRSRGSRWPLKWSSYSQKIDEIRLNQQFSRMIVATDYMAEELIRNGFAPGKVAVLAPVPPVEPAVRADFNDRNLIVYAGQIIRGKGVDVLLQALAQVLAPFKCLILGDGHHRARCEKISKKLRLNDRVCFAGYVPPHEVKNYYKEASLAVVSSLWPEPLGATGLEAMRCGLPVVAFDAGGIGEWLLDGNNGFLVPWKDHALFAQRVETLLGDKLLAKQMGQRALEFVSWRYDFRGFVSSLERLFADVLAERPAQQMREVAA